MELALQITLIVTSVLVILLVLLHRAKGGGLSTLFGGGVQSSLSGSTVVEKNLDRLTLFVTGIWVVSHRRRRAADQVRLAPAQPDTCRVPPCALRPGRRYWGDGRGPDTSLAPIGSVHRTQVGREATEPMREDIRLLGTILGDTVREQNGDEVFDLVERARVESFRVRRSEIDRAELAACSTASTSTRPSRSSARSPTSRCWPTSPRTSTANAAAPFTSRRASRRRTAAWPPPT